MEDSKSSESLHHQKLFVGGLSPHTSQESLYNHFSSLGSVKDCVLMLDRISGRSRCFGFVTMENTDLLDTILASDQTIDGKKADCKRAVPRESPGPATEKISFKTKKVFVGGLPSDITEECFREFFQRFGIVEDSVVMLDRDTGRPRGFGFVTFYDEEATEKVLETYEKNYINGKWIDCKKAMPKGNSFPSYSPSQMFEHYGAQEFVPLAFYPPNNRGQYEGQ